jgi:hypothetical protein
MRLHAAYGWQDPVSLTNQIVSDLQADSHGVVRFNIVDTQVVNQFPVFQDGFQYTATSWESDWTRRQPHQSGFDYKRFIDENNIVARVESGDIDEVWLYADPMASMWESTMAGAGAYWCNSPPVAGVNSSRAFVLMGWNYERGVGEAIHSYGHRVESIMMHIYGSWPQNQSNNWGRFTLLDKDAPGLGGVGNIHFPVNGLSDYDYANARYVLSNADDWYNYPYFTGTTKSINYTAWSPTRADPQRDYLNWWYAHIPHFGGRGPDGFLNDWWRYIVDIDPFKGGDMTVIPVPPSYPSATAISSSQIRVTWTDNSSNEDGFRVSNGITIGGQVGANVTSFTMSGLAPSTSMCFTIQAYNSAGASSGTSWACATTSR